MDIARRMLSDRAQVDATAIATESNLVCSLATILEQTVAGHEQLVHVRVEIHAGKRDSAEWGGTMSAVVCLNKIVVERSTVAKSLVQSAIDDAFRREAVAIQLERCWPLLLARMRSDKID